MNKLLILWCLNIFSVIYSAPTKTEIKISDFLQGNLLKNCTINLFHNFEIDKSEGVLSHCKNVPVSDSPEEINDLNVNQYYCIGILAANIELCLSNETNNVALKETIDHIKHKKSNTTCNELKQFKVFSETDKEATISLKKWMEVLNKNLQGPSCNVLCSEIVTGDTNIFCSVLYYINNMKTANKISRISVKEIPTQKSILLTTVETNTQQKPSKLNDTQTSKLPDTQTSKLNDTQMSKRNDTSLIINKIKLVKTKLENTIIDPTEIVKPNVVRSQSINVSINEALPSSKPESVKINQEKQTTLEITTESPIIEKQVVVEDLSKQILSNAEISTVSSTVNVLREEDDDFEDYANTMPKQKIEILTDEQDKHSIPTEDDDEMEESNFFSYFMFISVMFIAGYVVYHNKQKIMALLLEGRRDRNSRRRPNTASYRKLNSNLEEAVTSKCSGSASHVIY